MNLEQVSALTGLTPTEIYERTGKTTDIEIEEINPLFHIPWEQSEPEHVTVKEAAEITGFSESYVYALMRNGKVQYIQKGGRRYPILASLSAQNKSVGTNDVIDKMLEDPQARLYVYEKLGLTEILERLNRLEVCLQSLSS